jgi:hypothetical protein
MKEATTHENVVAKHVALPDPPEPIVAHHSPPLDIIVRSCHQVEKVEFQEVRPELPEEERPGDVQEWRNACIAHEMRHVRVPTPSRTYASESGTTRSKCPEEKDSRARHLIRKRERALHRREIESMYRNDEVRAERHHAF